LRPPPCVPQRNPGEWCKAACQGLCVVRRMDGCPRDPGKGILQSVRRLEPPTPRGLGSPVELRITRAEQGRQWAPSALNPRNGMDLGSTTFGGANRRGGVNLVDGRCRVRQTRVNRTLNGVLLEGRKTSWVPFTYASLSRKGNSDSKRRRSGRIRWKCSGSSL